MASKEGDLISAIFSDDPDVYIINEHGYKRLFLNPEIFKFYKHLGGFANVKLVTPEIRNSFPISGLFRNCEAGDSKVYGIDIEGEDQGELRWVNTSGDQAVKDDPDFFKKVFCINKKEFDWYPKATAILHSVKEVPQYDRMEMRQAVSTEEKLKTNFSFKEEGKVLVCHSPAETATFGLLPSVLPPSRSVASLEIFIASSAVKAHLEHGDKLGSCRIISPTFSPTPTPLDLVPVSTSLPLASSSFVTLTPLPTSITTPTPTIASSSSSFSLPAGATLVPTPTVSVAPPPPSSVTASSLYGSLIRIVWTSSADKYLVRRSSRGESYEAWSSFSNLQWSKYNGVTTAPDTNYDDFGVIQGYQYRYRVFGCDSSGQLCSTVGTDSNIVIHNSSTTFSPTPTPVSTSTVSSSPTPSPTSTSSSSPQSPASVTISSGTGKIMVSWTASASRYNIYLSVNNGAYSFWSTNQIETFFDYSNVSSGNVYRFKIYGCNSDSVTCAATGTESNPLTYGSSISTSTPSPTPSPTPTPTPTPTPAPTPTLPPNAPAGALLASDGSWCYTSDGDVYNTNGSVNPNYTSSGSCQDSTGFNYTDYCSRSNIVEFSCNGSLAPSGSGFTYSHINCSYTPGGETCPGTTPTCSSGVCVAQAPITNAHLAFYRNLSFGSSGPDVQRLQALLVNEVNYPARLITGYFGNITREAVKRLQEKYGVSPVSGYFGNITRQALRVLTSN